MEWQTTKSKGHQSVYDKAFTIFQERIKNLTLAEQEIEKERIQTNIDLKFEKRKVQEDLISMNRDRTRFAKEARNKLQLQLPSLVNREKSCQGLTLSEKQKLLRSFSSKRCDDLFPEITCTEANVPRIMKRSISKESQYHNWLLGFPKIKDSSFQRTSRNKKLANREAENESSEARAAKKHSKVENIVFNVPLTLKNAELTETARRYDNTSQQRREKAIVMVSPQNWNLKNRKLPKLKDALQ